jgi:hypothetical protein
VTALLTLAVMALVAVLDAWGRTRREPQPAPPRRNYDVLTPAGPRVGATRLTPAQRDVWLTLRVFGPADDTIVVIRPAEVRDARQ